MTLPLAARVRFKGEKRRSTAAGCLDRVGLIGFFLFARRLPVR